MAEVVLCSCKWYLYSTFSLDSPEVIPTWYTRLIPTWLHNVTCVCVCVWMMMMMMVVVVVVMMKMMTTTMMWLCVFWRKAPNRPAGMELPLLPSPSSWNGFHHLWQHGLTSRSTSSLPTWKNSVCMLYELEFKKLYLLKLLVFSQSKVTI